MSEHHAQTHQPHEHKSHKKEYLLVFLYLTVLTAVEIWVAEIPGIGKFAKGSSLTLLAVGKAFLVAYYYMHLKEETKWLRFIAAVPLAAVVYATVLCLETMFKPF